VTVVLAAVLVVLGAAAWLWLLARATLVAARMYQIEEYEAGRLFAWSGRGAWVLHPAVLVAALVIATAAVVAP